MTMARGKRTLLSVAMASLSSRTSPLAATMTGSSTTGTPGSNLRPSATASMTALVASMPIFTAPILRSRATTAICCVTNSGGTTWTPSTPSVFWAVSAVIALAP